MSKMNPNPFFMHRINCLVGFVVIVCFSSLSVAIAENLHQPIKVPLKINSNALVVDALLTHDALSSSGSFIIDTGATYTSISKEMADQLGFNLDDCPKVTITTANGRIQVPKIMLQHLSINGLEAANIEATVIPISMGASFSGLLGLSFLRQFVVTFDPQGNQLIFNKN